MPESPRPASTLNNRAVGRKWSLLILTFGIGLIAVFLGLDRWRHRAMTHRMAQIRGVYEIRVGVATSHLWLEEYVSGDQVAEGDVYAGLDRSLSLTRAMLGGERAGERESPLMEPLADLELRRHTAELQLNLERFRKMAARRQRGYVMGRPVGIGSTPDVEYDRVFQEVMARLRNLLDALDGRLLLEQAHSRRVIALVVVCWMSILGVAAAVQARRERSRLQVEQAPEESQEHLSQAQKVDAVGRLAGGIAHDINNYLAAIRGHCELVKRRCEPASRNAKNMDSAIRTVLKAADLIERLLDFSRKKDARLQVINLNRAVEGLEKMMLRLLGENVRLVLDLAEDLWNVQLDLSQVEQIIVNLLVNARDAMETGGTVTLSTSNSTADEEEVVLTLSDTGKGIPEEIRDKIFDPFFTTKTKDGSSGLGLATVYSIVTQHGGRVDLSSGVGEHTSFTIRLPRCREPTPDVLPGEVEESAVEGSERLLLVDDNVDFCDSTRELLESLGYRVTVANNGYQALASMELVGDEIELVLTDVVMPDFGGRELADRIRERKPVKVIFMSGHTARIVDRYGVEEGEAFFLKKPFSVIALAKMIRKLLDSGNQGGST